MAVVIKIGGSLFRDARVLTRVCDAVSKVRGEIAVVAGGGVLADNVREMQSSLGLDDLAAHTMALRTMDISGLALASRIAGGVSAGGLGDFAESWERGGVPVWLPSQMCDLDDELTCDWSTTSDAIAARLSEQLDGAGVVLLKSCDVDSRLDLDELARAGIVDPEFPKIVTRSALRWRVLGLSDHKNLADVVAAMDAKRHPVSDLVEVR